MQVANQNPAARASLDLEQLTPFLVRLTTSVAKALLGMNGQALFNGKSPLLAASKSRRPFFWTPSLNMTWLGYDY